MGNLSGRLDDFADLAYLRNLKSKAAPEIPEILRSRIIQKGPGLSPVSTQKCLFQTILLFSRTAQNVQGNFKHSTKSKHTEDKVWFGGLWRVGRIMCIHTTSDSVTTAALKI